MVCDGVVNNGDNAQTFHVDKVDSVLYSSGIHDMASGSGGKTWGRRKQANPKRTNAIEDDRAADPPLQTDTQLEGQTADSPHNNPVTKGDSGRPDDPVTLATENNNTPEPSQTETETMIPEENTTSQSRDVTSPLIPEVTSQEAMPTSGCHSNGHVDDTVSMATEEEKIQELMSRSDTVVIFPEPVSDQEDNGGPMETEDTPDLSEASKCPHCDEQFDSVDLLIEHWHRNHSNETTKHACPQCGVSFTTQRQLDKHMVLHSPSSQVCRICNKTFANVYRLQRHMISHEESSELRKFKCPECGKAFKFKHHLKEHIRIHSGEKPFECQNCGKRFSHSGSYSSHMTSKKCWVNNIKVRGSGRSDNIRTPESNENSMNRGLAPKTTDGLDPASLASMMYTTGLLQQPFLQFDAATASQLQNQFIAQMNSAQVPFLPHIPFAGTPLANPMIPGIGDRAVFGCLPPGGVDKDTAMMGSQSEKAGLKIDNALKSRSPVQEIMDENQNKEMRKLKEVCGDSETKTVPEGESNKTEAVNKVLEIVGATVNQQQQGSQDKGALSKLSPTIKDQTPVLNNSDNESRTLTALASAATQQLQQLMKESGDSKHDIKTELMDDIEHKDVNGLQTQCCKFCKKTFTSPISLHQHERYLCRHNQEIQRREPSILQSSGIRSPDQEHTDGEESTDERKIRVRSMITDEQVQILKTFYQTNQRPNKYELETLAHQIGFPKRVVQVWFQNMRARDRRKGRTIRDGSGNSESVVSSTTPAYIPKVPHVAMPVMSSSVYFMASSCPSISTPTAPLYSNNRSPQRASEASSAAEQPLDLTVKRPEAHTNKPFSHRPELQDDAGEILNLSVKENSKLEVSRETASPQKEGSPAPAAMAESVIFKYMKREGMVRKEEGELSPLPLTSTPLIIPNPTSCHSVLPLSVPLQINTTPAHSRSYANITSLQQQHHLPTAFNHNPAHVHRSSTPRSYDSGFMPNSTSPSLTPDLVSPMPSSLDSSFNSTLSFESNGLDNSAATYSLMSKPKRVRKKSWRQMESEGFDQDMEDSMEGEDSQCRKKRRSWKQHRVDVAEGLYACDQCDKMFNKQSSLARHKYEHSGQRPFPCDICTKAFKHKHHLTEHKRLHSGEKPFQCQKCGKRFSHSGSYSQHMNHRYKYCKPLMGEVDGNDPEVDGVEGDSRDMETETSDTTSP